MFEFDAFAKGTETVPRDCRQQRLQHRRRRRHLAAIAKYGIEKQVGYISTGGGAFLEVLAFEGKRPPFNRPSRSWPSAPCG